MRRFFTINRNKVVIFSFVLWKEASTRPDESVRMQVKLFHQLLRLPTSSTSESLLVHIFKDVKQ